LSKTYTSSDIQNYYTTFTTTNVDCKIKWTVILQHFGDSYQSILLIPESTSTFQYTLQIGNRRRNGLHLQKCRAIQPLTKLKGKKIKGRQYSYLPTACGGTSAHLRPPARIETLTTNDNSDDRINASMKFLNQHIQQWKA
jgi:hypothetical protein